MVLCRGEVSSPYLVYTVLRTAKPDCVIWVYSLKAVGFMEYYPVSFAATPSYRRGIVKDEFIPMLPKMGLGGCRLLRREASRDAGG
jgi:hypothetical protein